MKHTSKRRISGVLLVSLCLSSPLAHANEEQPDQKKPPKLQRELTTFWLRDLEIEDATFETAIEQIRKKYRQCAHGAKREELPLRITKAETQAEERGLAMVPKDFRIEFAENGISALAAVRKVGAMGGYRLKVGESELILRPVPDLADAPYVKSYAVPPDFRLTDADGNRVKGPNLGKGFARFGIPFPEGTTALYNPRTSHLVVRQTHRNHELVRQAVGHRDQRQLQVLLTSKLVHIPRAWLEKDRVMSERQFETSIRDLTRTKGSTLVTAPSVVTRNGQKATVEVIREFIYPANKDRTKFGSYDSGLALTMDPALEGTKIRLAGEVALNMFKNQTAVEFVTGFPNFKTPPGVKGVDDLDPRITEFDVVLESGQTVALSSFKSEPKGDQIIAFITATLIDPAGRRIR